jgi:putative transposase
MKFNPLIHHRRSIRLPGYDYTSAGVYFITLNIHEHWKSLFGDISDGKIILNECGMIVRDEWLKTPEIRPNVDMDEFVVMPNHLHGIIVIRTQSLSAGIVGNSSVGGNDSVGVGATRRVAPTKQNAPTEQTKPTIQTITNSLHVRPNGPAPGSIGAIIGQFKSVAAKQIKKITEPHVKSIWQRDYYEHIIRDDHELYKIRRYIVNNPRNWKPDEPEIFWPEEPD